MKKKNSKIKKFSESRKTDNTLFDLINKYDELRSIANAIYNSDYYMIATKKEQKEIEAAATCISKALVSAIGLEAINHDFLPDDSGNGDDHSWSDNLPDDSGNGTDTNKERHDAIKKIMNIAYGETKASSMEKAAARQTLNSLYGATGSHNGVYDEVEFTHTPYKSRSINDRATSIMAMNRKILSEIGAKSPVDVLDKHHDAFGNDCDGDTGDDSDGDEVKDNSEINLGNFIEGPFYGYQYLDICRQCGFDVTETLRRIEKVASQYHIQMINLVDIVDDHYQIKPDGKYTLGTGSVFFVTNKNDSSKSPVFILIYAQPYTKVRGSDISKFSVDIIPVKEEESTKEESDKSDDDIEFIGADAYYNISKVHPNSNDVIDLDATLNEIKARAKEFGIKTVTFVDTITDSILAHLNGEYSMEVGSLFCVKDADGTNFLLIIGSGSRMSDIRFQYIEAVTKPKESIDPEEIEESTKTNYVELIDPDFYFHIGKANPNNVIDLNATLDRIKDVARTRGINSITFTGMIWDSLDIYDRKYSLKPGSLFYFNGGPHLTDFLLVTEVGDTPDATRVLFIESTTKPEENASLDDIDFVGSDAYYSIDNPNSDIDLDATLIKIKEKAKEKGIKTITFVDTIKDGYHMLGKYSFELGSLFFVKNTNESRFTLVNDTNPTTFQYIYPVMTKKDDSEEDSSDSKEDDIKVVKDEETVATSSDEASPDYVINRYADADTSELHPDIYTKVAFPIFMKPTDTGTDVSFVQICDLYDFDISETVKRIKNAAYLEEIEEVNYIDSFQTFEDIFKTEMAQRWYGYHDGSLFLVRESTKGKLDPCFVILRKQHDDSDFDSLLYRINPIMRPAKIHGIKKIDIIDTYADGDVRIANALKNLIDIEHSYKLKEICDKRNYDYDRISSCLKGVTAIIGGGMCLTFEGTISSINSIVLVDPVVAYNTCSVFFVSNFVCCEEEAYFVIYMPITGKTKNGYNFRLYRIYPIPNLNQDPNTDSQDDSNVREINQFTAIYRANSEVSEADKDAYMQVEFSLVNHSANGGIYSLQNICHTWKFNFYDTIKRIRFVAYMNNLKEIKFAGTACSHEEILEKEVLYSNGSVLFVSDEEDPHFVIVEFVDGSTCLNRINPVKE